MSSVVFNIFNSSVRALGSALRVHIRSLAPVANQVAFDAGVKALRDQYNVGTLYVLVHSYDSDDGSNDSRNLGYFLSQQHAIQAGIELAFENGWKFISDTDEPNYESNELYVTATELFK